MSLSKVGAPRFAVLALGESDPFGLRLCWLVLALGARLASDSGLLLGIAEIRSRLAMHLVSETLESDSRIQLVWPADSGSW